MILKHQSKTGLEPLYATGSLACIKAVGLTAVDDDRYSRLLVPFNVALSAVRFELQSAGLQVRKVPPAQPTVCLHYMITPLATPRVRIEQRLCVLEIGVSAYTRREKIYASWSDFSTRKVESVLAKPALIDMIRCSARELVATWRLDNPEVCDNQCYSTST